MLFCLRNEDFKKQLVGCCAELGFFLLGGMMQKQITEEHRMDSTRVNADQLIEDLIRDTNLEDEATEGSSPGLQLFIGKDGVPALSSSTSLAAPKTTASE